MQRRLYEAILSNTPDLAYVWDLNHRFIYVNEGLLTMWGKTREEALGKNCLELGYEPWHAAMHDREIEAIVATGKPIRGEVPFTGTYGRRVYDYVLVPVFGPDGNVEAVAGTTRDVTEYRNAQDEHRRHAQQLEVLHRVGIALAAELDLDKLVQTVTDAGRELLGAQCGAFAAKAGAAADAAPTPTTFAGNIDQAKAAFTGAACATLLAMPSRGQRLQHVVDTCDAAHASVLGRVWETSTPIRSCLVVPVLTRTGDVLGGLFFGHEEPNAFAAECESVMHALASQAAVAIDNARLYRGAQDEIRQRKEAEAALSRQVERSALLSVTLEQLLASKDPESLVHELFPRVAKHVDADVFFNFLVGDGGDALRLHAYGGIDHAMAQSIARLEFGQAICGLVARQRKAVHATNIHESDEPRVALVRSMGIRSYFCNPLMVGDKLLGTLSFASRRRSQFEPDEMEFLTTVAQYVAISMERLQGEMRLQMLVEERTRALQESHARLRLSERMAALGTLAAGLGHDMGNLLMPIRVQLESIEAAGVAETVREELEAIRSGLEYLRRLSSGLRLLSIDPDGAVKTECTELRTWWAEASIVLQSTLPRGVVLIGEVPEVSVRMSRAAMTQTIFNLVQNAGDAMRERGKGTVTLTAQARGGRVQMSVSDDGPGMSDEVRMRCMEPFFTTKTREVSTGLGLALVYGLVQQAGGAIELSSIVGRGTTFVITLDQASPEDADAMHADRRLTAVLDVKDARTRAILVHDLTRSFHIRSSDTHGDAVLVVTDKTTTRVNDGTVWVVLAEQHEVPDWAIAIGRAPKVDVMREAVQQASIAARRRGAQQ